jgi:ABC-2 type transport system permease protein
MTTTATTSTSPATASLASNPAAASATYGRDGSGALAGSRRQTFRRAMAVEWIKIRTLRSTWVGMGSVILMLVGFGALAAAMTTGTVEGPADAGGPFGAGDPVSTVLTGANFAVLVVGVLGSLSGAREYSSRMIVASVAAVPRRWHVVVSKAVVFGAVTAVTALVGVLGAFWLGMAVLSGSDAGTVALSDDGVLRQVLGMAGYIAAIGLIGLGLGILLRSVAGSISVVVAAVMIVPTLAGVLLPSSWDALLKYLPSSAGAAFTTVQGAGTEVLAAGAGTAVLAAWVIATLAGAIVSITRRDV